MRTSGCFVKHKQLKIELEGVNSSLIPTVFLPFFLYFICATSREFCFTQVSSLGMVTVLFNSSCGNLWIFFINYIQKLEHKVIRHLFKN